MAGDEDAGLLLDVVYRELSAQDSPAETCTDTDAEGETETPTARETDRERQRHAAEGGAGHAPDGSSCDCPLCERPCETHHRLGKFWQKFGYAGPPYCTRCSSVFRAHLVTRLVAQGTCSREKPCRRCAKVKHTHTRARARVPAGLVSRTHGLTFRCHSISTASICLRKLGTCANETARVGRCLAAASPPIPAR